MARAGQTIARGPAPGIICELYFVILYRPLARHRHLQLNPHCCLPRRAPRGARYTAGTETTAPRLRICTRSRKLAPETCCVCTRRHKAQYGPASPFRVSPTARTRTCGKGSILQHDDVSQSGRHRQKDRGVWWRTPTGREQVRSGRVTSAFRIACTYLRLLNLLHFLLNIDAYAFQRL